MIPESNSRVRDTAPGLPERIPFLRSLRGRLIVVLTLFVGFTALILSVIDYRYVRGMLLGSVEQQLELRAKGLAEVLLAHVRQQEERVLLVASRTRLRSLLREFLDGEIDEEAFRAGTTRILRDARDSTDSFREISIADVEGRVITATDPELLGRQVGAEPAFTEGLEHPILGLPRRTDRGFESVLGAPARTNDGRLLGVVLVDADAEPMRRILAAIPSKFTSAEVRVAAQVDGRIRRLFSDLAEAEGADPQDDPALRAALDGRSEFDALDGFRGRDVLVAYRGVGYRGWGLVTQVDAAEAYAPIASLSAVVAAAGVLVALLGLLVGVRVAKRFTRPVLGLAQVAQRVGDGDLHARAPTGSHDEVGVLARAFNAMTDAVQAHRNHLEDLVQERTEVLRVRTSQLERSHGQLAELCRMLEDQADVMDRDLHRAELIQRSLLPDAPPPLPDFCVQTLYRPGRNIGGDLYDVIKVGERYLVLVVADASGHGVSAAMLAVLFKHRMRILDEDTGAPYRPATALALLNTALSAEVIAPGVFFTCVYCLLDTTTRELVVASAGHPPLVWLRHDDSVEQIEKTGPALGLYEDAEFGERTIELGHRDRVLLYTDGLFDISDGGPPDVETIAETLRTIGPHRRVLEQVLVAVSGGREREDRDDVTMVLLDAEPGDSHYEDRAHEASAVKLEVEAAARAPEITLARGPGPCFLCLAGRVTWTHGEALLNAAAELLEKRRELVIDLSGCDYLDSTMLGTLHEIARRAEAADVPIAFQNVRPTLAAAFAEVSMDTVLAHLRSEPEPVPQEREALPIPQTDLRRQRLRLLEAHEELAALSPENRAQFGAVIDALREEVDGG